jgi:hypothetical protein
MTFIVDRVYRRRGRCAARLRPRTFVRARLFASVRALCYSVRPERKTEAVS